MEKEVGDFNYANEVLSKGRKSRPKYCYNVIS